MTLIESMQTLSGGGGGRPGSVRRGQPQGLASPPRPGFLTNVVGLIEDHHGLSGQLLGHQVCNLGVQEVVVAVNHHIGMQDLGGEEGRVTPV